MTTLEVLVAALILLGLVGTVIPVLPGLVLVWAAVLLWAIGSGTAGAVPWVVVAIATVLAGVAIVVSAVLPGRRAAASGTGAPRSLTWVIALGTAIGFFAIPVVGALIGGPVAAYLAELIRVRDRAAAWRSAVEALKGFGIAVAIQLATGVAIAACWAVAVATTQAS